MYTYEHWSHSSRCLNLTSNRCDSRGIVSQKIAESKVGNAEEEAKRIVNMAKIEAENLKKKKLLKQKKK